MDDNYMDIILESCDDETQEALRELMDEGYDLEEAIMILDEEGLI